MKFLCDVHISFKILNFIKIHFEGSVHVNNILDSYSTKDSDIITYADENDYTILTKDKDFKNSYLLKQKPKKPIKINLGNISNLEIINILKNNVIEIKNLEEKSNFMLEISKENLLLTSF